MNIYIHVFSAFVYFRSFSGQTWPVQTGPARTMVRNGPKISPIDRFESRFVTIFCSRPV